jgi:hypothetical protein
LLRVRIIQLAGEQVQEPSAGDRLKRRGQIIQFERLFAAGDRFEVEYFAAAADFWVAIE